MKTVDNTITMNLDLKQMEEMIDEELRGGRGCNRVGRIARKIEETGCQERIAGIVKK